MRSLVRDLAWSETPLGPLDSWPQSLRNTVSTCLNSRLPILIWWGPERIAIYNDAYDALLGTKQPGSLGRPAAKCWPETWSALGPLLDRVTSEGKVAWAENQRVLLDRQGFLEECYFTFSYSPIKRDTNDVDGVSCTVTETTAHVRGERRSRTLRAISQELSTATSVEDACAELLTVLGEDADDLPFALVYVANDQTHTSRLVGTIGVSGGESSPSAEHRTGARGDWPLDWVLTSGSALLVEGEDFKRGLGALRTSSDPPPTSALLIPFALSAEAGPSGVLVVGLSPRLALDESYRRFLELVAEQVARTVANARALELALQRTTKQAELDRAKTAFFSNVSHEFRTPLTLMIGPTEEALAAPGKALRGAALELVHRNELRLLKLVNTLLDFSRIEAGRVDAAFELTDVAALVRDVAGTFRSAFERAGLNFDLRCDVVLEDVYVDRDMWEKIVLNLLSNAFKFTFQGGVFVTLRSGEGTLALDVRDSGVGIPTAELSRVFERFYRIEGTRSRSYEGSGIGLALVRDLARLHGGDISVVSREGEGTTFTVTIPTGADHLSPASIRTRGEGSHVAAHAQPFVSEVLRWLPESVAVEEPTPPSSDALGNEAQAVAVARGDEQLIVADDNADMREYLTRLLSRHWQVRAVADGAEALALARCSVPDLVLTDVMMPNLDGFGLLRALRDDPRTASVPVVMLSARAGEGPRIAGLAAGANDYLVKPFSARELIARISTHLELGRLRRASDRLLAEREQLLLSEREARREAEHALRAKDDFLAMLGHELRNPLAPIATALQLLRLRGHDPAEHEHTIIERQVTHLTTLVDDLLDVSRITQGKIELKRTRLELASLVERAIELASPLLEQRQHVLTVNVPLQGFAVQVDPTRFAQIIANLLTNAAKYTEVGGQIVVTAATENGKVTLSVTDNGIGIAAQSLPHVFDIFMQERQASDRGQGGLGLGLAIVRSLVHMHGGTVSAKSEGLGTGSTFTIQLPEAQGLAEEPAALEPAPLEVAVGNNCRVLVVDDNSDAAELLAHVMTQLGCETLTAHDGPSALALFDTFRPELALLDIGLPVMDGYELAKVIRSRPGGSRTRLIAVTGYGQKSDIDHSLAAGFNEHLTKPVDIAKLQALVSVANPTT